VRGKRVGRFQYFLTATLLVIFISPNHVLYALPFLELFPAYICPESKPECSREDHCRDPLAFPVDWESSRSVNNLVQQLGLECAEPYQIGMLGSSFFIGMTLFVVLITRLGDLLGRKRPAIVCQILSIPILMGIMVSRSLYLTSALLFLFGAVTPGREHVVFTYIGELVPLRNRTLTGSILLFADATTIGVVALYFLYVSKNWLYFQYFSLALNVAAIFCLLKVPESPKYLHSIGRFQEAREALARIAVINGAAGYSSDFKFVEEVHRETEETKVDGSLRRLVADKGHLRNLLAFAGLWVVGTFNTYLIYFQIKYMKGDFFVNIIVSCASDIVAYLLAGALIERLGIRLSYIVSFVWCLAGALMYMFLRSDHPHFIPVFLMVANFGNSWSVNVDWSSNCMLFPVIFASSTNGICNLLARISNIFAP